MQLVQISTVICVVSVQTSLCIHLSASIILVEDLSLVQMNHKLLSVHQEDADRISVLPPSVFHHNDYFWQGR